MFSAILKKQENSNFVGVFVFLFFLIPMFYPKIKFILKHFKNVPNAKYACWFHLFGLQSFVLYR